MLVAVDLPIGAASCAIVERLHGPTKWVGNVDWHECTYECTQPHERYQRYRLCSQSTRFNMGSTNWHINSKSQFPIPDLADSATWPYSKQGGCGSLGFTAMQNSSSLHVSATGSSRPAHTQPNIPLPGWTRQQLQRNTTPGPT